jgi:hypothetical protein
MDLGTYLGVRHLPSLPCYAKNWIFVNYLRESLACEPSRELDHGLATTSFERRQRTNYSGLISPSADLSCEGRILVSVSHTV